MQSFKTCTSTDRATSERQRTNCRDFQLTCSLTRWATWEEQDLSETFLKNHRITYQMSSVKIHSKDLPLREFQPLKWEKELMIWAKTHGASQRSPLRLSTILTTHTQLISDLYNLRTWNRNRLLKKSQFVCLKLSLTETTRKRSKFTKARTLRS